MLVLALRLVVFVFGIFDDLLAVGKGMQAVKLLLQNPAVLN